MQIVIQDLYKSFEGKEVLKGINYTFQKGKSYTILGKNGSGKTTLFNCISQEIDYDSGMIMVDDERPIEHHDVGYVYTTPMLPDFMTAYEFLIYFSDLHEERGLSRHRVDEYLDTINFSMEDRHRLIKDYSTGMKNKIQMLAMVLLKPNVLLMDEPLTSLDLLAAIDMKKMLQKVKQDCVMILSTHIVSIAKELSDQILLLKDGKLIELDMDELQKNDFEEQLVEMLKDA